MTKKRSPEKRQIKRDTSAPMTQVFTQASKPPDDNRASGRAGLFWSINQTDTSVETRRAKRFHAATGSLPLGRGRGVARVNRKRREPGLTETSGRVSASRRRRRRRTRSVNGLKGPSVAPRPVHGQRAGPRGELWRQRRRRSRARLGRRTLPRPGAKLIITDYTVNSCVTLPSSDRAHDPRTLPFLFFLFFSFLFLSFPFPSFLFSGHICPTCSYQTAFPGYTCDHVRFKSFGLW